MLKNDASDDGGTECARMHCKALFFSVGRRSAAAAAAAAGLRSVSQSVKSAIATSNCFERGNLNYDGGKLVSNLTVGICKETLFILMIATP